MVLCGATIFLYPAVTDVTPPAPGGCSMAQKSSVIVVCGNASTGRSMCPAGATSEGVAKLVAHQALTMESAPSGAQTPENATFLRAKCSF